METLRLKSLFVTLQRTLDIHIVAFIMKVTFSLTQLRVIFFSLVGYGVLYSQWIRQWGSLYPEYPWWVISHCHEKPALAESSDYEGGRVSKLKTAMGRMGSLRPHDRIAELESQQWAQPSSHPQWTWIPSVCATLSRTSFLLVANILELVLEFSQNQGKWC